MSNTSTRLLIKVVCLSAVIAILLRVTTVCAEMPQPDIAVWGVEDVKAVIPVKRTFFHPAPDPAEHDFWQVDTPAVQSVTMHTATSENTLRVMPDGLLFRSYIAAPNEPRFASVMHYDLSARSWRWDSTLGGRVGLLRQDQPAFLNLDQWQIDLEGATMTRLNPHASLDMESADYRFGLLWTGRRDNLSFKFGYFHISSHAGDEFLISHPGFQRINYARESLVLGVAFQPTQQTRHYAEVAWANSTAGGAEPLQFQLGTEYTAVAARETHGAPFAALNLHLREEVNFVPGLNIIAGWQWKSHETGRAFRFGAQYYNGPSHQFEFFTRYDNQLGFGIWYDY